jgi:hypothetical protein
MKTLLASLIVGALAFAHAPTLAQDKKPEPPKEEVKKEETEKTDTKKTEKSELKKDEGKKKVKKCGC